MIVVKSHVKDNTAKQHDACAELRSASAIVEPDVMNRTECQGEPLSLRPFGVTPPAAHVGNVRSVPPFHPYALFRVQAMMPSFYRGESKHTDLFERLNLVYKEYEALSQDLNNFICRSVLEKMESTRGRGGSEGGATLGELRRVCHLVLLFVRADQVGSFDLRCKCQKPFDLFNSELCSNVVLV